jgi:DNA-binding CsgD family transcriptional regulator
MTGIRVKLAVFRLHSHGNAEEAGALNNNEQHVVTLMRRGLSHQEIARSMRVTPETLSDHVNAISDKYGISNKFNRNAFLLRVYGLPRHVDFKALARILPDREMDALKCFLLGKDLKETSESLFLGIAGIRVLKSSIFDTLGAKTFDDLFAKLHKPNMDHGQSDVGHNGLDMLPLLHRKVAKKMIDGVSVYEIAKQLNVMPKRVEECAHDVYAIFGVEDLNGLLNAAYGDPDEGMIAPYRRVLRDDQFRVLRGMLKGFSMREIEAHEDISVGQQMDCLGEMSVQFSVRSTRGFFELVHGGGAAKIQGSHMKFAHDFF